jgi:hypothetical protein
MSNGESDEREEWWALTRRENSRALGEEKEERSNLDSENDNGTSTFTFSTIPSFDWESLSAKYGGNEMKSMALEVDETVLAFSLSVSFSFILSFDEVHT